MPNSTSIVNDTRFNLLPVTSLFFYTREKKKKRLTFFSRRRSLFVLGIVFNKVIVTTLKYTPMVFSAQIPYKEVAGK